MTQYIPAPWTVSKELQFNDDIVVKDKDGVLHIAHITKDNATFEDGEFEIDELQQLANARLISAAPELLHELELKLSWMLDYVPKTVVGYEAEVNELKRIIAKAKGE